MADLKKATRFYEETLGLEKKYEFSTYVGFECGGVEIGLIPNTSRRAQRDGKTRLELLVDDVEKVCNKLRKKGVKFTKELHEETWGDK